MNAIAKEEYIRGSAIGRRPKESLLILNGTLCDAKLWRPCTQLLTQSPQFDERSFIYPDVGGGESVTDIAKNLADVIRERAPVWIIGYSLGGMVALEVAVRYQAHIRGLILICTTAIGHTEEKEQKIQEQLCYLEECGIEALLDDILLPSYFGAQDATVHHAALLAMRTSGLRMGAKHFRNQRRTLRTRSDQYPHLGTIMTPTLVIAAEHDLLCTADESRRMARALPQSRLYVSASTGHAFPFTRPEELAREVMGFVEESWGS